LEKKIARKARPTPLVSTRTVGAQDKGTTNLQRGVEGEGKGVDGASKGQAGELGAVLINRTKVKRRGKKVCSQQRKLEWMSSGKEGILGKERAR